MPRCHPVLSEPIRRIQFAQSDRDSSKQALPLGSFAPLNDLLLLTQVEGSMCHGGHPAVVQQNKEPYQPACALGFVDLVASRRRAWTQMSHRPAYLCALSKGGKRTPGSLSANSEGPRFGCLQGGAFVSSHDSRTLPRCRDRHQDTRWRTDTRRD